MRKFFKTVAIVTVFSVCEKFLGFLYRIYMSRAIGSEGVGLYQVALSVFAFLLTITCSGTPITVSRLMTKYKAENKTDKIAKVVTAGIAFTLFSALPVCVIFFALGDKLSFLFADADCLKIFFILLPGLIFNSVYSIIRGVFWGNKDFLPYSIIELLEEICMIIVGIILMSGAASASEGAYFAGLAVLVSYLFSFTLSSIVFFARKNKLANPKSEFKPLILSALPVTAMRTVTSLAVSLVSVILPLRLVAAGYSQSQAMSMFGAAAGQAMPLLFIPTTLIGSFTLVLVPEISESYYNKKTTVLKNDIEKALKFTAVLTCLFVPVFFVCGEEIGVLIFGSPECGTYLTAASFLMVFMSISGLSTSILNSIGCEKQALAYCIFSGVFMILSIWFLPHYIGIYALLVGFSFVYGLTTLLNLYLINKKCAEKPKFLKFFLLLSALLIPSILLGLMLEKTLLPFLGTFLTFTVCSASMVLFYLALCVGFGLIDFGIVKSKFSFRKNSAAHSDKKDGNDKIRSASS